MVCRAHGRRQHGEQTDLGGVVGVHDRRGVRGVHLGARLVTEDPERHHRRVERAVLGDERRDERGVRGQIVGVELQYVDRRGACRCHRRDLLGQPIGAPRREHDGGTARQARRQFQADLAASAENHHHASVGRVLHDCDYVLR